MSDARWQETPAAWESRRAFVRAVLGRPRYALDADELDDLTGEALVRIFVATRSRKPDNPEGFMTTIAHRTALDWTLRRKRWRTLVQAWDAAAEHVSDPALRPEDVLSTDVLDRLRFFALEYFLSQQPVCVEVARAYFADTVWRDLAREVGERANTLAQRWHRCREQLITEIRSKGPAWLLGIPAREV